MREKVIQGIFKVIDDINAQLPEEKRMSKSLDTILIGPMGALDSLGLVNFIVGIEQQMEERFGMPVMLTDEMFKEDSPLQSVEYLAEYLLRLLEVQKQ